MARTAPTPKGVSAQMLRRHLIALGGATVAGASLATLSELLTDLGESPPLVPLPSQLSQLHVTRVRDVTRRLGVGDTHCCDPEVSSAAAAWATRLLDVSGPEPVRRALLVAVSELHIEAGWSAFDAGLYRRALYHYARTDPFGDMDRPGARLELMRGRLDAAETLATASLRRWEGGRQQSRLLTGLVQATIHVTAGERSGLHLTRMARQVIDTPV